MNPLEAKPAAPSASAPTVTLHPVNSTSIAAIGHDGADLMHVLFKDGALYVHHSITPQAYEAMRSAPSVGRHYATHHRGINFRRVGG